MAFGLAAAGLIGAGVSAASSIFSGSQSNYSNRKLAEQQNQYNQQLQQNAFDYNTQQSEVEFERNLEQWNRENEYNTPAAQMQRYIDAGLNPNLIYGSGTSAGTAASSPQFTAARYNAPTAERSTNRPVTHGLDPYQAVSIGNQLALQRAQVDNLEAQAEYTKINTEYKRREVDYDIPLFKRQNLFSQNSYLTARTTLSEAQVDKLRQEVQQLDRTNPLKVELLKQELKNLRTANDIQSFSLQLQKLGVTNQDSIWTRLASRAFLNYRSKSDRNSFINKLFDYITF